MNKPQTKNLFLKVTCTLLIGLLSSTAFASYKEWPLRIKGEVRYMKMIKVYDVSLISPSSNNANNILDANISKCLKLEYAVSLSVDKFRLATNKILERQHNPVYLKTIAAPLETFQKAYKPVKKGDIYNLCYNGKNKTMSLDLNDKNLVNIQSAELAKTYLGIWLSKNKPISRPLYNSMFAIK